LITLFNLVSGGLTTDEKNKLLGLGISQATIDGAMKVISPSATAGARA
jgi:hypothetical protein